MKILNGFMGLLASGLRTLVGRGPAENKNYARFLSDRAGKTEPDGGYVMRKWVLATIGCLSLVAGGRSASAATTDGTLITNVACGTFLSASGMGFAISYCCTANVIVANPCVALQKRATPTVQSSGGVVTFELIAINCSCSSSAFNIMVTDRLPDNMAYFAGPVNAWNGTTGAPGPNPISTGYKSPDNLPSSWTVTWPAAAGQVAPYFLRWQLEFLGPCESSAISFQATVL